MDQKEAQKQEDRILVERVLGGNHRAFGVIVRNTQGLVAHIVFKMISDPHDRNDIAQDIYLKVFQKLGSFRFQAKLSTWIAQIAYHTCLNYLQKKKSDWPVLNNILPRADQSDEPYNEQHPDPDNLEDRLLEAEQTQIIRAEIENLPPQYKLLITLFHQQELSYHEIGEVVDLPEGTIKSYLFRARKMLKDRLTTIYNKGL